MKISWKDFIFDFKELHYNRLKIRDESIITFLIETNDYENRQLKVKLYTYEELEKINKSVFKFDEEWFKYYKNCEKTIKNNVFCLNKIGYGAHWNYFIIEERLHYSGGLPLFLLKEIVGFFTPYDSCKQLEFDFS